jgi:predicted acyl esterase
MLWTCSLCLSRIAVPPRDPNGLEKFEGLDLQTCCPWKYAIVNVDTRGSAHGDGQTCVMETQNAEDRHDVVEAIGRRDWCNCSIGMAGNG